MMSELAVWVNEITQKGVGMGMQNALSPIQSLAHRGTAQVASKSLHASMQCISAIQQEIDKLESNLDGWRVFDEIIHNWLFLKLLPI